MWSVLHAFAWGYPEDPPPRGKSNFRHLLEGVGVVRTREHPRDAYAEFYSLLARVLPCGACCKNYARVIGGEVVKGVRPSASCRLRPGVFASRERITRWMHSVHNCNRRAHGKRVFVGYEGARRMYGSTEARAHVWGRPFWESLLFVAWNYPARLRGRKRRAAAHRRFFCLLRSVVPGDAPAGVRAAANELYDALCARSDPYLTREVVAREVAEVVRRHSGVGGGKDREAFFREACVRMGRLRK